VRVTRRTRSPAGRSDLAAGRAPATAATRADPPVRRSHGLGASTTEDVGRRTRPCCRRGGLLHQNVLMAERPGQPGARGPHPPP
jgi:hypothetical protein